MAMLGELVAVLLVAVTLVWLVSSNSNDLCLTVIKQIALELNVDLFLAICHFNTHWNGITLHGNVLDRSGLRQIAFILVYDKLWLIRLRVSSVPSCKKIAIGRRFTLVLT